MATPFGYVFDHQPPPWRVSVRWIWSSCRS